MVARIFEPTQLDYKNRRLRGFKLTCSCGVVEKMPVNTVLHNRNDGREEREVVKKFTRAGWIVGDTASRDLCPACVAAKKRKQSQMRVVEQKVAETKPDAPRQMGRDDRRIIFEKINEVYVNEKTGYGANWTDKKVAEGLGCPQAWVATVRDEMFGPHGSNEEIDKQLAAATTMAALLREEASQMQAQAVTCLKAAEGIDLRLREIQKAIRP